MQTQKTQDCIQTALNNKIVKKAIQEREAHKDYWLSSIHAKIINRKQIVTHNQMIVRVGFDFAQRYENFEVREDIIVDVSYSGNRKTNEDEFKILNVIFVPEI